MDESVKNSKLIFSLDFDFESPLPYKHIACAIQAARFSSISWSGISSGQKAYLNLFSSIWNCLNKRASSKSAEETNLICIDEGDLYLHPQWQIEFIERLITSLPKLSNGKTQIIITTHSPILVSDLPHQCIITLPHLHNNNHAILKPISGATRTFGANLYDIYEQSFGLQQQRSGNISTKYISSIIRILDKDEISAIEQEELRLALSIIDDELIANHIKKRIKGL
jgi:predicted ATP-binding protein involved in virulence